MAFDKKGLQVLTGYGSTGASTGLDKVFREARYITADNAASVETGGYFNAAAARLQKGTVIMAVLESGGSVKLKFYIVTANNGSVVTIGQLTVPA